MQTVLELLILIFIPALLVVMGLAWLKIRQDAS